MERSGRLFAAIQRYPILTYYIATFAVVWTWVLAIVLPSGFPGSGDARVSLFPLVMAGMAFGPPIVSLALTGLLEGRKGLGDLGRSLVKWRVSPAYYLIAGGLVPACALLVLTGLTVVAPQYQPGFISGGWPLVALGLAYGLIAGGLEEIGWTGFAIRRLSAHWNIVAIGIVLGALHGIWHVMAGFWGEGASYGPWYIPYFVMCWIVGLTGLRLLIAWLYDRTRSILIAQLAHASYTGGLVMIWPQQTSPMENTIWTAVFALLLLGVVWTLVSFGNRLRLRLPA